MVNQVLSQLYNILKCNIALLHEGMVYFYPSGESKTFDEHDLVQYHPVRIDALEGSTIFYTDKKTAVAKSSLELAALHIKTQLCKSSAVGESVMKVLEGSHNYSDLTAISQLLESGAELHLIVLSGKEINGSENEMLEIISNSLDVRLVIKYQGNLVLLVGEAEVNEACSDLQKNILTELYIEAVIAIGGRIEQPQQIRELYAGCVEAFLLKQSFGINQNLLDNQGMLVYRLVASIDPKLKRNIVNRIFTSRFVELLNNEMELTIEEMFKNNINLTDTSARLYIHRNTLLYRIEKIYKLTGFDLRKFEDSMLFKLAWLMYKEKSI